MRRPGFERDGICGRSLEARLRVFLKLCLRIGRLRLRRVRKVFAGDERGSRVESFAEIHCADERLEDSSEDRWTSFATCRGFALSQQEQRRDVEAQAGFRKRVSRNERGAPARQRTFRFVGMLRVERCRNDVAEHRVTEEFEALIGDSSCFTGARALVCVRIVGKRCVEQCALGLRRGPKAETLTKSPECAATSKVMRQRTF